MFPHGYGGGSSTPLHHLLTLYLTATTTSSATPPGSLLVPPHIHFPSLCCSFSLKELERDGFCVQCRCSGWVKRATEAVGGAGGGRDVIQAGIPHLWQVLNHMSQPVAPGPQKLLWANARALCVAGYTLGTWQRRLFLLSDSRAATPHCAALQPGLVQGEMGAGGGAECVRKTDFGWVTEDSPPIWPTEKQRCSWTEISLIRPEKL